MMMMSEGNGQENSERARKKNRSQRVPFLFCPLPTLHTFSLSALYYSVFVYPTVYSIVVIIIIIIAIIAPSYSYPSSYPPARTTDPLNRVCLVHFPTLPLAGPRFQLAYLNVCRIAYDEDRSSLITDTNIPSFFFYFILLAFPSGGVLLLWVPSWIIHFFDFLTVVVFFY
jgi:hypothetical protein